MVERKMAEFKLEVWQKDRVRGAIYSYSRGDTQQSWVMGVISGSWGVKGEELEKLFNEVEANYINYDPERLRQLKQKCKEEGLL